MDIESPINPNNNIANFAMSIDENFDFFGKDPVLSALKKHFRDDSGYCGRVIKKIIHLIETSSNIVDFQIQLENLIYQEDNFGLEDGEFYGTNAVLLIADVLALWKNQGVIKPLTWW
jgi:uncharacterized membrane protein